MIELQKNTDFSKLILEHHSQLSARTKTSSTKAESVHLLNQEKDGSVLYAWDDVSEFSEGAVVTHFGLYDPVTQTHRVIHTYNQRVHVVSCSINQDKTLMGFTTLSNDINGVGEKRSVSDRYSAYLAEIKAQNPRVFSLNLERPAFLKVQFLYDNRTTAKETNMLVMLHKESIGLYSITLARVGKSMVMKGQPKTKQVAKKFVWCQWDCHNQQLFFIHHRRDHNGEKQAMLTNIQFYENGQYDNLDVPLNFPFYSKSSGRSHYADIPLHTGIPDTSINACVLTQSNGTFCICYQHRVHTSERRSKSSPLPRTSPLHRTSPRHGSSPYQDSSAGSDVDSPDINYYICMVHHAKTLHGSASNIPSNIVKKGVVSFSWLGDVLMVMLPGYFVHLLNVGIEFEPCNHVLLHSRSCSSDTASIQSQSSNEADDQLQTAAVSENQTAGATWESDSVLPVLSLMAEHLSFVGGVTPVVQDDSAGVTGSYVYDKKTGSMYKVIVNMAGLVEAFIQCYMPMTRTALLHYTILHTRDLALIKQLFSALSNDITSAEVPNLMTEFLIAMTYSAMRRQIDKGILKQLPFTSAEPFRGQFDKTAEGERLARISYSSIQSVNILTLTAKERMQKKGMVGEDMLDLLRRNLRWTQLNQSRRFSLNAVKKAWKQLQSSDKGNQGQIEEDNFIAMMRMQKPRSGSRLGETGTLGNFGGKWDSVLGVAPAFLQGNFITDNSDKQINLTKEVLMKHLQMSSSKDSKLKVASVAKEYINCQIHQSRLLCHLLWSLREQDISGGFLENSFNSSSNRSTTGSLFEYELFQMLERYNLILQDLAYPVPQKFPSYFTSLALRCLDNRMFVQYVDYGVLQLTGDFMAHMLTDLPDDPEYYKLKLYLISKLPKSCVDECYKIWGHNQCNRYFAINRVEDILSAESSMRTYSEGSETSRRGTMRQGPNDALDKVQFKPLASFLGHLSKVDSRRTKHGWESPIQITALEEVALHHTTHETNYDMGTVNF